MSYLPLNREIVELLNSGDVGGAIGKLRAYFDLAEADLVEQLAQAQAGLAPQQS